MRLYHRRCFILLLTGLCLLLAGCAGSARGVSPAQIHVQIEVEGEIREVDLLAGSTVQQALNAAELSLGTLDRVEPPLHSVLTDGDHVRVIRVEEEYVVEQAVIPFEQQTLRNETLAIDQELYLQRGRNGLEEITYRRVFEDGVEVSNSIVKRVTLEEPVPEIIMIGVQSPFVTFDIPGKLVYLRDGSVWVIEGDTGSRTAVVTTGDLDGRILALSDDGTWLLFTRRSEVEGEINRLWAKDLTSPEGRMVDLGVPNVVHFADFVPGSNSKIVFSTVEPRPAAPGWQANNDLHALTFSPSGWTTKWGSEPVLEANSGGVYGWWGMTFAWSPDGQQLAFSRPDRIGLINFADGAQTALKNVVPLQTGADWAWVPGITWAPDGNFLYVVDHNPPEGSPNPEEAQVFDLVALPVQGPGTLRLVSQSGMFSFPITSPALEEENGTSGYRIAYLQAIFPDQSETSRYRLVVMDRDGSNQRVLFPTEERSGGIAPRQGWGAWSPAPMPASGSHAIALVYEGNLWIVDTSSGQAQQVTGDGLTERVIWK
jgi:hypothetical protein